ncbi:MAG: hypothetical protein HQK57_10585 [Deltaproteobacteria bacterium]|nr:hypothetical protein [Deltaproteobacteria bacterium]
MKKPKTNKVKGYILLALALGVTVYLFGLPLTQMARGQRARFLATLPGNLEMFKISGNNWAFRERRDEGGAIRSLTCVQGTDNSFWARLLARILLPAPVLVFMVLASFGAITGKRIFIRVSLIILFGGLALTGYYCYALR